MPEHTPLPWYNESNQRITAHVPGAFAVIIAQLEAKTTRYGGGVGWEERNANIEFIVRACNAHDELLAALEAVLPHIGRRGCTPLLRDQLATNARAAIARARGLPPAREGEQDG